MTDWNQHLQKYVNSSLASHCLKMLNFWCNNKCTLQNMYDDMMLAEKLYPDRGFKDEAKKILNVINKREEIIIMGG